MGRIELAYVYTNYNFEVAVGTKNPHIGKEIGYSCWLELSWKKLTGKLRLCINP